MRKSNPPVWAKRRMEATEKKIAAAKRQAMRQGVQERKILTVAARLFWENGYQGTSIDEIARKTGMNKATIYYYFKNKVALLYEIISAPLEEMIEIAEKTFESDLGPTEKLKSLIRGHIEYQLNHLGFVGIGHIERKNLPKGFLRKYLERRDKYESFFRQVINAGIEADRFASADVKLGSLFTLGFVTSITQWYDPKGRFSVDEIASEACKYVLNALAF